MYLIGRQILIFVGYIVIIERGSGGIFGESCETNAFHVLFNIEANLTVCRPIPTAAAQEDRKTTVLESRRPEDDKIPLSTDGSGICIVKCNIIHMLKYVDVRISKFPLACISWLRIYDSKNSLINSRGGEARLTQLTIMCEIMYPFFYLRSTGENQG